MNDPNRDVIAAAEEQYERARVRAGLVHTREQRAFAVGFIAGLMDGEAAAKKLVTNILTMIDQEKQQ